DAPAAPQSPREQERLVESPLPLAPRMERYGDEEIGCGQRQARRAHLDEQIAEGRREGAAAGELERPQGVAERVLVVRRRARVRERGGPHPARTAAHMSPPLRGDRGGDEPTERQTADVAPRRIRTLDAPPARAAQRIPSAGAETRATHRAKRRKDEV